MAEFEFTPSFVQPVYDPDVTSIRFTRSYVDAAYYQTTAPNLQFSVSFAQSAYYQQLAPNLLATAFFIQYIQPAPEVDMATDVYPTLRGLTFQTTAKPTFSTGIATHTSGRETRTSYWEQPRWQFDLQYDYLPNDSTAANTDYKTLVGFFCGRAGAFEDFLFSAPDDNYVDSLILGVGDGDTVDYTFFRPLGTFSEPVGQVDTANQLVWVQGDEDYNVPASAPYTVTLLHTVNVSDLTVSGYTLVTGAQAAGQYSFDSATSTLTFNSADAGNAVVANYKYQAVYGDDYAILLPNTLRFTVAPPNGATITSSFNFFFVCRFLEDQNEFDQFYDKLWSTGQITLQSVLL